MNQKKLLLMILAGAALSGNVTSVEETTTRFYLELNFTQANDTVGAAVDQVEIRSATTTSSLYELSEDVEVEVLAQNTTVLFSAPVPVSFVEYTNTYPSSATEDAAFTQSTLYLPYQPNAAAIQFTHDNRIISKVNLTRRICVPDGTCSEYCSGREADIDCTCGDGICQSSTNEKELCLQDCRETASTENNSESSSESQEIDGSAESSAGSQADEGEGSDNFLIYGLIGFLAFLLILIARKVRVE